MAGGREIKSKIKSVQNTRKVTRALEMVSASKIRKAQDRMKASRPYAKMMRQVIGHIAKANSDYVHPFMASREGVKRVGYIVVSADRGLCGALNSGLFRKLLGETIRARTGRLVIDHDDPALTPTNQLRGNLIDFGYDARTASVVVTFDAVRDTNGTQVMTRRFSATVPVVTPEAGPVGAALNQAANDVAGQVADWVR